jgi:3'(2'), 5'-bisphosphate nucleotidase
MIDIHTEDWLYKLMPQVVTLAREAGDAIMAVYSSADLSVEYKKDNSPLTLADMASHKVIVEGLTRLTPGLPVLSEESDDISYDLRSAWHHFWLVDPLDGTKEFIRRNGEFTVNIALIEGNTPILGVVYAPVIDRMYFAARGVGAFKAEQKLITPIKVSAIENGITRVVVSRSHHSSEENLDAFIGDAKDCEFVSMGSSLKFCLVAEGAAHIYPRTGPTMEWDTAAAQCVLEQAGGSIADLEGNPLLYNKPSLLNPGFLAKTRL